MVLRLRPGTFDGVWSVAKGIAKFWSVLFLFPCCSHVVGRKYHIQFADENSMFIIFDYTLGSGIRDAGSSGELVHPSESWILAAIVMEDVKQNRP